MIYNDVLNICMYLDPTDVKKRIPHSEGGSHDASNTPPAKQGETQARPNDQTMSTPKQTSSTSETGAPHGKAVAGTNSSNPSSSSPSSSTNSSTDSHPPVQSRDLARKSIDDMRSTNRKRNLDGDEGGGGERPSKPTVSSGDPLTYAGVTQTPPSNPPQSAPPIKKLRNNGSSDPDTHATGGQDVQIITPPGPKSQSDNLQVCEMLCSAHFE